MRFLPLAALVALGASCQASDPPVTGDPPGTGGAQGGSGGTTGGTGGSSGASTTGGAGGAIGGTMGGGTGGSLSGAGGSPAGSGGQPPQGGAGMGGMTIGGAENAGGPPVGGSAGSGAGMDGAGAGGSDAGTSGTSGAAGSGGSPPAVGCTGSELLCEDFEAVADGMVPAAAPWHALDESCQYQTSQFTMGVTSTLANGGTKSLKVTNKHFAQCRLSGQFDPVDDFWVRAYSYWEPGLDISNRETLDIDLTPGFRTADDPAVRFGYRSKSPCEMYAGPQITIIGLAGGEATGCGSRAMPQGEWFCFEAHVQQASNLIVSTYINGEAISYQSTGKPVSATIQTDSPITEKVDHLRLGIFSTGEAQGSIYLDDVAVATTRLGCGN